jgi:chemotaxis protein CheX
MPATAEITETLIRDYINRAVTDVFQTTVGRQPVLRPQTPVGFRRQPGDGSDARPQVVGTVGFVGEINGLIYLHLDLAFARLCACHLRGMSDAELEQAGDGVINDAVGQLTNLAVGSFANGLGEAGYRCDLTTPSILLGRNFTIQLTSEAVRHIYFFDFAEHRMVADIQLKLGE